jgi:hypothetical protein
VENGKYQGTPYHASAQASPDFLLSFTDHVSTFSSRKAEHLFSEGRKLQYQPDNNLRLFSDHCQLYQEAIRMLIGEASLECNRRNHQPTPPTMQTHLVNGV